MNNKWLSPIAFILAILCLFLPFASLSCEGQAISTKSGFELATGFTELFEQVPPNIYIIFFIMAAVAGLIFSLMQISRPSVITAICGGAGIAALLLFMVDINNRVRANYEGLLVVVLEYGFYLAGFFLLAAILLSLVNLKTPAFSGARTQGKPATGAGHFGGPPPQRMPSGARNISFNQQMHPQVDPLVYPSAQPPINQATVPIGYSPTAAVPRNIPQHYQHVAAGQTASFPKLIGISGQYAGQKIDLSSGPVTIGRDPSVANLVYRQTNKDVSRRHCTVSYDPNRQSFTIVDSSTNGTFLLPYERLIQGKQVQIESGARFFISDPSEQFEVRLE
jgi:hypothetical protein